MESTQRAPSGYESAVRSMYPYAFHVVMLLLAACTFLLPAALLIPELGKQDFLSFSISTACCLTCVFAIAFAVSMTREHARRMARERSVCGPCQRAIAHLLGSGALSARKQSLKKVEIMIKAVAQDPAAKALMAKALQEADNVEKSGVWMLTPQQLEELRQQLLREQAAKPQAGAQASSAAP